MGLLDSCAPLHNTLQVHTALAGILDLRSTVPGPMIIKQYSTKNILFFYLSETTSDNSCCVLSGGFPPATKNVATGFFHGEIEEK